MQEITGERKRAKHKKSFAIVPPRLFLRIICRHRAAQADKTAAPLFSIFFPLYTFGFEDFIYKPGHRRCLSNSFTVFFLVYKKKFRKRHGVSFVTQKKKETSYDTLRIFAFTAQYDDSFEKSTFSRSTVILKTAETKQPLNRIQYSSIGDLENLRKVNFLLHITAYKSAYTP